MYVCLPDEYFVGNSSLLGEAPNDAKDELAKEEMYNFKEKGRYKYKPVIIGEKAIIREFVTIDLGINRATEIGSNVYIHTRASIHHDCHVHKQVVIGPGACICGTVTLLSSSQIGAMACIHQGTVIGAYSMVGMSAAVVNNVPPFVTVSGIPAKILKLNTRKLANIIDLQEAEILLKDYTRNCTDRVYLEELALDRGLSEVLSNAIGEYLHYTG